MAAESVKLAELANKQLTVIGYAPTVGVCHHHFSIDPDLLAAEKYERLIQDILKKVTLAAYKSGFPLTQNQSMRDLMLRARKVAGSQAPALILGETGTGKENYCPIHPFQLQQVDGPFVAVTVLPFQKP